MVHLQHVGPNAANVAKTIRRNLLQQRLYRVFSLCSRLRQQLQQQQRHVHSVASRPTWCHCNSCKNNDVLSTLTALSANN